MSRKKELTVVEHVAVEDHLSDQGVYDGIDGRGLIKERKIDSLDMLEFKIKQILGVTLVSQHRGARVSVVEANEVYRHTPSIYLFVNNQRDQIMSAVREFLKNTRDK